MDKKYKIIIVVVISLILVSLISWEASKYIKMKKAVDLKYQIAEQELNKTISAKEKELQETQGKLTDAEKNTLYGFFYDKNINKIVYKTYKMNKNDFKIGDILKKLSLEENSNIINYYKNIGINKEEFNENSLHLDISVSNWDNLKEEEKYNLITSFLWTLYSSSNLDNVFVTIDGQNINIYNKDISDIYHRYYLNPMNNTELKFGIQSQTNTKYFPIVYKHGDYEYLETNIFPSDPKGREALNNIGKYFNKEITNIIYDSSSDNGIVKVDINLKDKNYLIDKEKDKEFIEALKEAFHLSLPFKHYVYINSEVNINPLFLNYTYLNNPKLLTQ